MTESFTMAAGLRLQYRKITVEFGQL